MAFKKYAKALVSERDIRFDKWVDEYRAQHGGILPDKQIGRVASTIFRKCDPKRYLLSHATIVASVDTYSPKGVKTGKNMLNGVEIDVKFPDFRIKPECHEYINNNNDGWSRPLLLATYRTFIGSPNYLEHIQVPSLSKGFIVDALARDLGNTCYTDILVATDKKHQLLVNDILSGVIDSLSMGCISQFTICTKCGNVAIDDSQLCACILYEGKGSKFADENGILHPISELCGHVSIPESNTFIEASWVRTPAFVGAKRRNILNPDYEAITSKIDNVASIYELRQNVMDLTGIMKAASRVAQDEEEPSALEPTEGDEGGDEDLGDLDFGGSDDEPGDDSSGPDESTGPDEPPEPAEPPEPEDPNAKMKELLETAQKLLMESLVKGLEDTLKPKPEDVGTIVAPSNPMDFEKGNDNLIRSSEEFDRKLVHVFSKHPNLVKWASRMHRIVHVGGLRAIRAHGLTANDLLTLSWIEDTVRDHKYPAQLYKVAMAVGPSKSYPSEVSYLAACGNRLGRKLSRRERQFFSWKGKIGSLVSNI